RALLVLLEQCLPAMGEFDETIGFTLMGVIIDAYLTGVIMTQFSTYLTHDLPGYKDPLWVKCLVAFLFVINISQAGAAAYMAWFYCVTNFANPEIVYGHSCNDESNVPDVEDLLVHSEQDFRRVPNCNFADWLWIGYRCGSQVMVHYAEARRAPANRGDEPCTPLCR
ncbi:hypothetical protein C8R45DRAFT_989459, partial [Mycena sanguinolenta]